jgi:mono/diheme cytochrome c family protein
MTSVIARTAHVLHVLFRKDPSPMSSRIPIAIVLALLATTVACNKDSGAGAGGAGSSTTAAVGKITPEVKELFKSRCATCHGETGHGDGPASAALNPKPRAYSDVTWQNSVKDDDIKKTITMGGAAVGKSPIMPASPDLADKPELDGLVAYVRSFKGK